MAKKVKIIAATKGIGRQSRGPSSAKLLRVAAYARVSSSSDEQENSFANQVAKWNEVIDSNPDYVKVKIYTDEGISGTSINRREGFQEMMEDAKAGLIDRILCKSISRFSRNVLDTIKIIRDLKSIGVEVCFDNEHLSSFDPKSEFIFTILGSIAQEESRHISENVRWTFEKEMENGTPFVNTTRFLGYDKSEDKTKLIVNEEQAKTVRRIFDLYDAGEGCSKICRILREEGVKNGAGSTGWYPSNILQILKNEKYVGDLLLQKTYTTDFLGHKRRKNTGERQQYELKDAHEAIIGRDQWDRVQARLAENAARYRGGNGDPSKYANKYPLSGMLICAKCGNTYKRRLWNSTSPTCSKNLFQCNHYSTISQANSHCDNKPVSEALAEQACCEVINKLFLGSTKAFVKVSNIVKTTLSADKLKAQRAKIDEKKMDLSRRMDELARQRLAAEGMDTKKVIDDYWDTLRTQYDQLDRSLKDIQEREASSSSAKNRLDQMLKILSKKELTPEMLTKDIIETFIFRIFVTGKNDLVFVVNATHTMNLDALIAERSKVVNLAPIYQAKITKADPVKKATISYKVVCI